MKKIIVVAGLVMFMVACSSTSICTCPGNSGGECKCVAGSCECGPCKK